MNETERKRREFFIQEKSLNTKEFGEKLWHEKYRLDSSLLPKFIDQELAAKILTIGKAINFLRRLCGDSEWIMGPMAKASGLGYYRLMLLVESPVYRWGGGFWLMPMQQTRAQLPVVCCVRSRGMVS